jgi:RNA polymerase sigma-70 factor, ECF subfamily
MPGLRTPRQWGDEDPPDVELLRQMRRGDVSALEVLYTRYAGLVFTLALRIVRDPELAREVLQDTFLRSWNGRETYAPDRGRVPWWLLGIARNRAIDLVRSRPHQGRLREQDAGGVRLEDLAQPEAMDLILLRREVIDALQGLTSGQRRAIELAYYDGFTQTEIARELGEPLGTVKSRTREAMDRLREVLRPLIQTPGEASQHRD